jgi:hypothetical protein
LKNIPIPDGVDKANLHDIILLLNYFSITIGINTLQEVKNSSEICQDEGKAESHMTHEEC